MNSEDRETNGRRLVLAVSGRDDPVWSDDATAAVVLSTSRLNAALPRPRVWCRRHAADDTIRHRTNTTLHAARRRRLRRLLSCFRTHPNTSFNALYYYSGTLLATSVI